MDTDLIVLLDSRHNVIGAAPKLASHHANTPLHLAFSSYIFNRRGQLLVTRRAESKKVWPDVWTNTCCGHPAPGEGMEDAITRRLDYELGLHAERLQVILPDYTYRTPPFNDVIENEFCPVYFGFSDGEPRPNPDEISDYRWMDWDVFVAEAAGDPTGAWSWWCKDQLRLLIGDPSKAPTASSAVSAFLRTVSI